MQEVITHIEGGNFGYAFAIAIAFLLVNTRNVSVFWDERRKRKLNVLLEASKSNEVSEPLQKHFQEEIEVEYFRLTYGVKIQRHLITTLLAIKDTTNNRIPFNIIISSRKYIVNKDDERLCNVVQIGWGYVLEATFNVLASIILCFCIYAMTQEGSYKDAPVIFMATIQIAFGVYQSYQFFSALLLRYLLRTSIECVGTNS
ncbi:hypothetical protein ACOV11_07290 [Vibrio natriegens]